MTLLEALPLINSVVLMHPRHGGQGRGKRWGRALLLAVHANRSTATVKPLSGRHPRNEELPLSSLKPSHFVPKAPKARSQETPPMMYTPPSPPVAAPTGQPTGQPRPVPTATVVSAPAPLTQETAQVLPPVPLPQEEDLYLALLPSDVAKMSNLDELKALADRCTSRLAELDSEITHYRALATALRARLSDLFGVLSETLRSSHAPTSSPPSPSPSRRTSRGPLLEALISATTPGQDYGLPTLVSLLPPSLLAEHKSTDRNMILSGLLRTEMASAHFRPVSRGVYRRL
jgi:hypothetical protein